VKVVLDPRVRWLDDRRLLSPTGRLLTLGPGGRAALDRLARGTGGAPEQKLAVTLLDSGAAHPHPSPHDAGDVTVVIPVRDRVRELEVCLAALKGHDVLVVDDGSTEDVAAVCARHHVRCVRRANGGPAAARNTALPLLDREFVAFLDSDCLAPTGWLEALRGHFEDPAVVAVAPRVVGGPRSPLDLGPDPAVVRPGAPVAYVPTAALLVRRSALLPFDEQLRYGEDVDLVWRLVEGGGVVRYDPSVVVEHREPVGTDRLLRRFRYGTSAAPLAQRHPGHLTHLVLPPWPTAVMALLLSRRPAAAMAVAALMTARLDLPLHQWPTAERAVAQTTTGTAVGLGRALAMLGPLGWALAAKDRRAALLLAAPVVQEWWQRRPAEPPHGYAARVLLDEAAYGAGVIAGCVRYRTVAPLVPRTRG
jgi:mycofactocin system glycosyltransferase